jgi:hypothetical protein
MWVAGGSGMSKKITSSRESAPMVLAPHSQAAPIALLILDMVSCWDFPDAQKLRRSAAAIAPAIAALVERCRTARWR